METHSSGKEDQRYSLDHADASLVAWGEQVLRQLPYEANAGQIEAIAAFAHFLFRSPERSVLVLDGYAGTGKTSLTGAIVKTLAGTAAKCVLLAPTGRAAHVFAGYAGHPAYTIHRKIYRQKGYGIDSFSLNENKHTGTVFIVDEASMIANYSNEGSMFGTGRLLDDLITYVYNGHGCRLALIGDSAQLPPVGQTISPALSPEALQAYGLKVYMVRLKNTVRQAQGSGILRNATIVRNIIDGSSVLAPPHLQLEGYDDIEAVPGEYLQEAIDDSFSTTGNGGTIVITRSNRRAAQFNLAIRSQILYCEDELMADDLLMVAKNNYYWASEEKSIDFIANGDVARVSRVWGDAEERYGLRFANVSLDFPDHDNITLDAKIVLDALVSDTPALSATQSQQLFNQPIAETQGDKRQRFAQLKRDPYYNALQVKFAYAVTCYKAQGGSWDNVFIDMSTIQPEALSTPDFLRWLYTAITRARKHVYLINCPLQAD